MERRQSEEVGRSIQAVTHGMRMEGVIVRSGQVWEHAPEQHVAASTFRQYSRASIWPSPRQMPDPSPSP